MRTLLALGFFALGLAGICACSDDDHDHTTVPLSCADIIQACHPLDLGSGPIHDCHENAEATTATEATCANAKAACLALCTPKDSGAD